MDFGNAPHLHLLLNHFPTIGTMIGFGLLLVSLVRRSNHLSRVSLEAFFMTALLTLPAYLSGVAAQLSIQGRPDVSEASITVHHDAALLASVSMLITGMASWLGLWQGRRLSRPARGSVGAVLLLSVVTIAFMARAANIGGEIRHPEIRAAVQAATTEPPVSTTGWLTSATIKSMVDYPWVWPAAETLHFIGLCLLFAVFVVLNLRILGAAKNVSYAALHRLLPWATLGFAVNVVTGIFFFVAAPEQYATSTAFYWKIGLILAAGVNFLYLTVSERSWALRPGDAAPTSEKLMAVSGMCLWVGVMYWGRMLPFLGVAF